MKPLAKCLKDWNATIEALGQGKQTLIIRRYKTNLKEFLLYPTANYANKDNYLESFQDQYQSFVEENAFPKKEGKKVEIKYYATLEKIVEKLPQTTGRLRKYYIWTPEHVKSYLRGQKAHIWVLRVYKLKEPYMVGTIRGASSFGNLKRNISLEGINPILSDAEFSKTLEAIDK